MTFDRSVPCSFSLISVQKNAPATSGVYGLSNAREWLLVGETDNVKAALIDHLQETHTPLLEREPTGFIFELCIPHNRVALQNRLIQEYQPLFDQRLQRSSEELRTLRGSNSYIHRVLVTAIHQWERFVGLFKAIHRKTNAVADRAGLRNGDVVDRPRQPQIIVETLRPHVPAGRRMRPVLDVSFPELAGHRK